MNNKTNEEIGELARDFVARTVEFYNELEDKPFFMPVETTTRDELNGETVPKKGRNAKEV